MVNPAFLRVQSQKPNIVGESSALVLETPLFDNPDMRKSVLRTRTEGNESVADLFAIDLNEPISANSSTDTAWQTSKPELSPRCIQSLVDVLITAWQVPGREGLITCDFVYEGSDSTEKIAKCEAKVTRLESNTVMVVICDITERVRRFEAEKTAVAEMTARKKDSEANR